MIRSLVARTGCCVVFLLASGLTSTRGDLITELTVSQTAEPSGLFLYVYTLSDLATSDVPAGGFVLDIAGNADLRSITGPNGWDLTYSPGDTTVTWVSSDPVFDLHPGNSTLFSFLSPLDSNHRDYLVVGFGETDIFTNAGQIAGPGIVLSAVPEPSTLTLLGTGAIGLFGYAWRRSRRPSLR